MIKLYIPKIKDLWFREMFMSDAKTMEYNNDFGGTILFPKEKWNDWYDYWLINTEGERFYRYLINSSNNEFVGEIAYHYDREFSLYIADVIIYSKYRGNGFGRRGLQLLCDSAKSNGIDVLYDNIAINNSAITLFLKEGFTEEYRTKDFIMLKKEL